MFTSPNLIAAGAPIKINGVRSLISNYRVKIKDLIPDHKSACGHRAAIMKIAPNLILSRCKLEFKTPAICIAGVRKVHHTEISEIVLKQIFVTFKTCA